MKVCKRCSIAKPRDEFSNNKSMGDGKAYACKPCIREYGREHYRKNPEQYVERRRANREITAVQNKRYREQNKEAVRRKIDEWHARNPRKKWEYHKKKYERPEGRAMHLFNAAKKRRLDGFTLTLAHVTAGVVRGFCAVTGIPFHLAVNNKEGITRHPFAPSLDKIDPKLPYTDENTRVVIWQYNAMKGELSDAEVLEICRVIVARAV